MTANSVIVGVSGGVDSSVAALLLQQSGVPVAGMFMHNWEEEGDGPCRSDADRKDAVQVCAQLGIPFHARNFAAEYREQVFATFLDEYRAGRTPNPDILCNREIKFRVFLDHARTLGADRIATGHYAQVDQIDGRWRLLRAVDRDKDQTYFLHALDQEQLGASEFPIGHLDKSQVRELARHHDLPTHAKKDSTGICFIGERDFRAFLAEWIPAQPGEIRSTDGDLIGQHQGAFYYTLGQRSGLGIGGVRGSSGEPWYVAGKDVTNNVLHVAQGGASHWLASRRLRAGPVHWISGHAPATEFRCVAQTRHRQPPQPCLVQLDGEYCLVSFDDDQRAVAAGQSVVFYDGDECLGGAVIDCCDAPFGGWIESDA